MRLTYRHPLTRASVVQTLKVWGALFGLLCRHNPFPDQSLRQQILQVNLAFDRSGSGTAAA